MVRVNTSEKLIAYSFQISVISLQIKLMGYVLIPRTSSMLIPLLLQILLFSTVLMTSAAANHKPITLQPHKWATITVRPLLIKFVKRHSNFLGYVVYNSLFIHLHNGISTISNQKISTLILSTATHTNVVIYSLSWMHCTCIIIASVPGRFFFNRTKLKNTAWY